MCVALTYSICHFEKLATKTSEKKKRNRSMKLTDRYSFQLGICNHTPYTVEIGV